MSHKAANNTDYWSVFIFLSLGCRKKSCLPRVQSNRFHHPFSHLYALLFNIVFVLTQYRCVTTLRLTHAFNVFCPFSCYAYNICIMRSLSLVSACAFITDPFLVCVFFLALLVLHMKTTTTPLLCSLSSARQPLGITISTFISRPNSSSPSCHLLAITPTCSLRCQVFSYKHLVDSM